jgi:hypothetical protein
MLDPQALLNLLDRFCYFLNQLRHAIVQQNLLVQNTESLAVVSVQGLPLVSVKDATLERAADCYLYQYWLVLLDKVLDHQKPGLVVISVLSNLLLLK